MKALRPVLLVVLVVGIALTLASEPSVVSTQPTRAQAGYGGGPSGIGSDTVPPRNLAISGEGDSDTNLVFLIGVIAGVVIVGGAVALLRRRGGD